MLKAVVILSVAILIAFVGACKKQPEAVITDRENKVDFSKNAVRSYAVTHLSVVPLRAQASNTSEMVSQMVFGDAVEVLGSNGAWCYVRMAYDTYEGWVKDGQIVNVDKTVFDQFKAYKAVTLFSTPHVLVNETTNERITLVPGSSIPELTNNRFQLANDLTFRVEGLSIGNSSTEDVVQIALHYLGVPYLWGGRSSQGVDCSGLMQMVFKQKAIQLLRDARQQVTQGNEVALNDARAGDLVFFKGSRGNVVHVGMFIDDKQNVIHASGSAGKVQLDPLKKIGFDKNKNAYSVQVHSIKRMM